MKRLLLTVAVSLSLTGGSARAGSFEDGFAAYTRGNYVKAVRSFRDAAAQGNVAAQYHLGRMYSYGIGVIQDYVRAYMWFDLVSAAGNGFGTMARDAAARKMTPQQIEEAQNLARECHERNFKTCD